MKYEHSINVGAAPAVVWAVLEDVPALTGKIGRRYVATQAEGLKRRSEENR